MVVNSLNNSKYQVFLMSCPCNIPVPFISHNWIVTNDHGVISRWETGYQKGMGEQNWGYLRKNPRMYSAFDGITLLPYGVGPFRWNGKLLGFAEGDDNSLAHEMIEFIKNSPNIYPHCDNYTLLGPNSNTYPQWILDKFPAFKAKLPITAVGKNYK